ncbi:MAG TPA: OmpA family protein [Candidatus Onthomorpha intestinigallinarum]|uniref:OmpA family protein n=1 Tax=Candidatus Onthomorpha intestinigallinarum TaxID=2840880 RepID=A0A9D1RI59_9BACT|nr:OmpA family protein [Candidatus Onthomorpha intestinigallinarum]
MRLRHLIVFLLVGLSLSGYAQRRSLTELADEAFESKQYTTAVDLYKKAYTKVKGNRQEKNRIMFQQAECYRFMDDKKQAIKTYQRLVKAKYYTVQPKIFLHMADFQKFYSEWDAAEYNYKEYLKLVPDDALAQRRLQSIALAKKWIDNPTRHQVKEQKDVNTEWNEWAPRFMGFDQWEELTFTSSRPAGEDKDERDVWTGEYFSNIYTTTKQKNGDLGEPSLISIDQVNTDANEGELVIVRGEKTQNVYFSRCNIKKNKQLNCAIYTNPIEPKKGNKKNDKAKGKKEDKSSDEQAPAFVMIDLGDTAYNYFHPAISSDELTLYFSSNRPGGEGDYDLWKATRSSVDEPFGNVVNLGKQINTEGKEEFPTLRSDTRLYFSSDGLPGLGGFDLFYTEFVDGEWSEPQNLMYPINSPYDEIGIVFNHAEVENIAAEESGYFSSNREGGTGGDDLYSFYRAPLLFSLSGKVRDDKSMQPIEGARIKLIGDDNTTIEARTNRKGEYEFSTEQIKYNVNYRIQVSQVDYFNTEGKESTVGLTTNKDLVHDFKLVPIPKEPIVLPEIRYDLAKWDLKDQYQDSLSDLLIILVNNPTYVIELASHTDSRPFLRVTNDTLSQRRAESVVEFLHARGIERERLVPKGYGDRVPRTLKHDCTVEMNGKTYKFDKGITLTDDYINKLKTHDEREAAHQLNRRTEFRILRTDFVPQAVRDSLADAALKAPVVDMVSGTLPPPDTEVPIVYTDNNIKVTMINGDKAQIYIILNGKAVPCIYDERYRDAAVLDWDVAMEFLLSGRITKDDFRDKDKAFDEDGNILDNSVLTFRSAYIGKYFADKYEVIVRKGMQYNMIVNKNGLTDFGTFTFSKARGEIIFEE